jgi:oligopeptide/dipeptide ABC transporter ATP-binding protein
LLLQVHNATKHYRIKTGSVFSRQHHFVKAVDGVSIQIDSGETFGLVGESGSGKSTLGRLLLLLEEMDAGRILYNDHELDSEISRARKKLKGNIQAVFQDPYGSLNPKLRIGRIIAEPLRTSSEEKTTKVKKRVCELLERVGLTADDAKKFPHQFSGGQRQRIGIARAIATNPRFIVLDEPVSALDVSVQAQIINLLMDIQRDCKIAYLFIAHNIEVVEHVGSRVGVMYLGKLLEVLDSGTLHSHSLHPYTQLLINSFPIPDPEVAQDDIVWGRDICDQVIVLQGCRFHPRCQLANDQCRMNAPELVEVQKRHFVACHQIH